MFNKGKVCIRAKWPIRAGAFPGFRSMKRLGVFLLPPGWDACPSQGYPPALNSPVPIYTPGWREALWELSVLPKNTTQCPRPGLEPGRSTKQAQNLFRIASCTDLCFCWSVNSTLLRFHSVESHNLDGHLLSRCVIFNLLVRCTSYIYMS